MTTELGIKKEYLTGDKNLNNYTCSLCVGGSYLGESYTKITLPLGCWAYLCKIHEGRIDQKIEELYKSDIYHFYVESKSKLEHRINNILKDAV